METTVEAGIIVSFRNRDLTVHARVSQISLEAVRVYHIADRWWTARVNCGHLAINGSQELSKITASPFKWHLLKIVYLHTLSRTFANFTSGYLWFEIQDVFIKRVCWNEQISSLLKKHNGTNQRLYILDLQSYLNLNDQCYWRKYLHKYNGTKSVFNIRVRDWWRMIVNTGCKEFC